MMDGSGEQLWHDWAEAADRDEVSASLAGLYQSLDEDVAGRGPTCWLSGKCCHFDSYGHRLYVTGLEIAWVMANLEEKDRQRLKEGEGEAIVARDGCVFQVDGLCGVHEIRPLGCRIYFCDPKAQGWQNDVYEKFQNELRALHNQFGVEYRYMEWRAGLAEARNTLVIG